MTAVETTSKAHTSVLGDRLAHAVIIYLVALLLTLPLFIILLPFVPELTLPIGEGVRVDHILTFVVILIAFIVLVRRFQIAIYGVLIIGALALTVSSVIGHYTFGNMYEDYAELLRSLRDTAASAPLASQRLKPFHDADKLRRLVVQPKPVVRKTAVKLATANFSDVKVGNNEFTMVQAFSIFKEINHNWKYVSDVKGGEYFAPPDESLELMAGDCDDHAVLMATCIKAIGGEVRLVRTEGHVYPEMKIGTDEQLERAAYLIRKELFTKEVGDAPLYHHTDADGLHWINLDYTRDYPGGELMSERIVGILDL
ncbi:MAG: transglutaminase family protein [Flavobacteriales bacterium]|nr:transglutaminase family protein [Flavobacteriales bacterium]MBK6944879.1 transglutaminase family protein [Flavobacteriales bacterium]MBK7239228.1 transglutaminase family protein [Flavobacteriales bacterium]MBP9138903.1 transglutaminase family protein [Flavobacteriales bacterium]HQV52364.1 transglutaminase family protein [Flavobacteriales bacterium]